jgi:hypothetical protein
MNPVYNGSAQKPTATLKGVVSTDSVTLNYTDWSGNVNAGSYEVTVSITDDNYLLPANLSASYSISPKMLTVSWNTTSLTYNGQAQRPIASVSGAVTGQNIDFTYSDTSSNVDAGNYSVSISITDTNYTLPSNAAHSYSIAAKTVTVSWSGTTLIFNGLAQAPTATFSGAVSGESVSFRYGAEYYGTYCWSDEVTLPANSYTSFTLKINFSGSDYACYHSIQLTHALKNEAKLSFSGFYFD